MKFISLILFFVCSGLYGQTSKEQLAVTYTYNFGRNITWKNEDKFKSFKITIFGKDQKLKDEFIRMARTVKLKKSPISINQVDDIKDIGAPQIIYIVDQQHEHIPEIFEKVEGKSVLLVTYNYVNKRLVMINLFEKDKKLFFEINKANILNNELDTKPDLILFGGTEIDVAKLYRKGQKSLAALERRMKVQETQLTRLKTSISQSEALIKEHTREISAQQKNIKNQEKALLLQKGELMIQGEKIATQQKALSLSKRSLDVLKKEIEQSRTELEEKSIKNKSLIANMNKLNNEISGSRKTIKTQIGEIDRQRELLASKIRERDKLIDEISGKVSELTNLRGEFNEQKGEVEKREVQIAQIHQNISTSMDVLSSQKEKIAAQGSVLKTQGKTIATQKSFLHMLWFVVVLVTLLVATIARAYYIKKKANNELKERELALNETLGELKVAEKSLIGAKEEALSASRSKSEFLANMSHEIRTPMNAILGFSELLSKRLHNDDERKFLSSIEVSGRSLLRLINDILDLSKVEAGKFELDYRSVNTQRMFAELETVFAHKLSKKNLVFKVEIDENIPLGIIMDETRLRQVLFNLIGNAIKFTSEGFVKVFAYAEKCQDGSHRIDLCIDVKDSGIGVPDDQKEMIFGAFEQQVGQSNATYGGTGLGLAISRNLVELMEGTVNVVDNEDGGAIFQVRIPQVEVAPSFREDSDKDEVYINFEKAKILIVDDIPLNRELLCSYLEDQDFELLEAGDGLEAVDIAIAEKPDLILMDMKMPIMDGYEATTRIKQQESTANIPIIAVTASAMKESEREILSCCDSSLRKPINQSKLFNEIYKYIKGEKVEKEKVLNFSSVVIPENILAEIGPQLQTLKSGLSTDAVKDVISCLNKHGEVEGLDLLANELQACLDHFDIEGINGILRKCV